MLSFDPAITSGPPNSVGVSRHQKHQRQISESKFVQLFNLSLPLPVKIDGLFSEAMLTSRHCSAVLNHQQHYNGKSQWQTPQETKGQCVQPQDLWGEFKETKF